MNHLKTFILFGGLLCFSLRPKAVSVNTQSSKEVIFDSLIPTIHIFVSLADNKYQGIVPIPKKIGNGQDAFNNLYWGCGFGIKTFFKKSKEWRLIKTFPQKLSDTLILERLVFKHAFKNIYLVADAYDGKQIKQCTIDFLNSCAGLKKGTIQVNDKNIGIFGNSTTLAYIGHDGLMDFELENEYKNKDSKVRNCIILACISKSNFSDYIKSANANPLVWTTGLMCPEA